MSTSAAPPIPAPPIPVPPTAVPPTAVSSRSVPEVRDRTVDVSERIAARLLEHPDVAELHGGPHGTTATHLPGRRVVGVQVGTLADGVQVAVVLHLRRTVRAVAVELQVAVRAVLRTPDVPVHVTIADVVTPDEAPPAPRVR